jgi:hypothetical protein
LPAKRSRSATFQGTRALAVQTEKRRHSMTIKKVKGGYRLESKKGKNLGTYDTKAGAEKRERQVQYFKHKKGK